VPRVRELAALLEAPFEGDPDLDIRRVAPLGEAGPDELAFVAGGGAMKAASSSRAGCLLAPPDFDARGRAVIRHRDPRAAAARLIARLQPPPVPPPGIHPTAVVGGDTSIAPSASIGAGCVIGDGVRIGERTILHPRVTVYHDTSIGDECVIHSGAVIGADGFGFVLAGGAYEKFPQVGRVEIGNRVEIGANSCVDRAALGVTSIGDGTKLDNLVHIAHNCRVGRHVVIAAQTGLSGGVVIEDYAVIGGQVGIGDKARIESRAVLGSGSGVLTSKIVPAGQVLWGTPARPLKQHLEQLAVLSRLAKKRKARGGSGS
jgi:UDP-3-O-[3-hydroxymyristoyl] glucosamine N-acyltransferase